VATRVRKSKILLTLFNCLISETPYLVPESATYLLHKPNNGQFLPKFPNFYNRGNQDRSM